MKKKIFQISLILIMVVGIILSFMPSTYAASLAGIKYPPTVKLNETFSVSLIYPAGYDITAAQANVTVKFSDNTTQTDTIVYTVDKDLNLTVDTPAKFTAKVAGTATISVTGIYMYKGNGETVEPGGSKTETLTIIGESNTGSSSGNTGNSGNTGSGNAGTGNSGTGNSGNENSGTGNSGNGGSSNSGSQNNNQGNTNNSTDKDKETPKFTDVNETVYTTATCNVRKSYSTDSESLAKLEKDTKLTRKGVGDNNWSKVEYNGQIAYISSQFLTTTEPKKEPEVVFKDTHENLYAKQNCNLRASWSTESEKVGYLEKGQEVERTGYADNGWSRIIYNGKTVYVASRLLVVEKPEEDEEPENTVENENLIDSTLINENIEDPTNMSEEERLKEIQDEIGVLPEVGINAANIAYVFVTLIAICGITTGIIYMKKIK